MNTSVRKEVIDSLGGIDDCLKSMEKSLRQHEMRPFDVEPNYYEDLMLSRNPSNFKQSNIDMDNKPVSSKKEFLKRTMTDKDFIHTYGKVVSASPYRAVVRRMDYSSMIQDDRSEEENSPTGKFDDDFERDESMFQTNTNIISG